MMLIFDWLFVCTETVHLLFEKMLKTCEPDRTVVITGCQLIFPVFKNTLDFFIKIQDSIP